MKKFAALVLRYRLTIIFITIGLTIFFGYGVTKVTINSDMLSYLKPDDPVVKLFNRVGDDYGGNTLAMVAVESDEIFTTNTLNFIKDLSEKYSQIKGVSTVTSLTNILDIKKTDYGLEISKLIDKNDLPQGDEELLRLKEYTLNKDMYAGKLISKDGKITLLVCRLQSNEEKEVIATEIMSVTEEVKGNYKIYYSGLPLQMIEVNELIIDDLGKLIPIVVIMIILVLFLSFKSKRGVALPLFTVLFSTVWAVGLMYWLNVQLSIISNIMPIILIAIGTAYSIHFISKYNEDVQSGADKISGIKEALSEVGVPILLTGITTLVGFLSFAGSSLTAVTDFGIFTAFGVGVAMLLSVTFVPAVLSFMKVKEKNKQASKNQKGLLVRFMDVLGSFVLKNEKIILLGSIIIIIAAAFGIPRIETEVNMTEYFPEDSDVRISADLMQEQFGGSIPIQIVIDGDIKSPFVLKQMFRFQKYMESLPDVNNTQSMANLICEMNDVMNGHYTIPETKEQVANLLFMLEGEDILDQLVNKEYTEGVIQGRFGNIKTKEIIFAVESMKNYIQTEMDTSISIVHISELNSSSFREILDFHVGRISTAVIYDAIKRLPSVEIEKSMIEEKINQLALEKNFQLTEDNQQALKDRLFNFFQEEADIEIDSESIIFDVTAKIVEEVKNGTVSENQIANLLRSNVPSKYWRDDPESIESTAEFIMPIIKEKQHHNRIEILVSKLLHVFPADLQNNQKFHNDLRDDLWVLNEEIVGISMNTNIESSSEDISLQAQQAGMLKVMKQINEQLLNSQMQSLLIALGLVLIIMIIQFRSIKLGAIITSPIVLTVLINFAIMGYVGVPLDNATMMIASIAIGIGIDYSIHFSSRFRVELKEQPDELAALDKTLETTGLAIVINALTVALGFIILMGSNILPMQRFGWLIALTMLISACAALTFLPSLILTFRGTLFNNNSQK
jgi:predicted RND superfamily exporter protein